MLTGGFVTITNISTLSINKMTVCCITSMILQAPYNKVYFEMIGNEQAQRFFQVDRDTGDIKLKTSLLQDPTLAESYQVIKHLAYFWQ